MATGDVAIRDESLPYGWIRTESGRISAATRPGEPLVEYPFERSELIALDESLRRATRESMVRFNVLIADTADLGADPASATDAVFPNTPEPAYSVLLAVFPNQRAIEVRTGSAVADRVGDRTAQLGVSAATASFKDGNLIDGIISAIRVMSAAISQG